MALLSTIFPAGNLFACLFPFLRIRLSLSQPVPGDQPSLSFASLYYLWPMIGGNLFPDSPHLNHSGSPAIDPPHPRTIASRCNKSDAEDGLVTHYG